MRQCVGWPNGPRTSQNPTYFVKLSLQFPPCAVRCPFSKMCLTSISILVGWLRLTSGIPSPGGIPWYTANVQNSRQNFVLQINEAGCKNQASPNLEIDGFYHKGNPLGGRLTQVRNFVNAGYEIQALPWVDGCDMWHFRSQEGCCCIRGCLGFVDVWNETHYTSLHSEIYIYIYIARYDTEAAGSWLWQPAIWLWDPIGIAQ